MWNYKYKQWIEKYIISQMFLPSRSTHSILYFCRERSEVTFNFRPFIFNGILMFLIRLHGDFFHKCQEEEEVEVGLGGKINS